MYTITIDDTIRRDSDGASIPEDMRNRDYRRYLVWVDEGNLATVEPAPDPAEVLNAEAATLLGKQTHRVIFKALLKLENRVRALEGLQPLTASEYRALAKASYFEEIS